MQNLNHKFGNLLNDVFDKLNDNSMVRMETFLIEDLICARRQNCMDIIYEYVLKIKESVDRKNLSDTNLAKLDALELLFENKNISFKKKSATYKKHFLNMLQLVVQHKELYEKNNNCKVNVSIDSTFDTVKLQYTTDKICDRKDQTLAKQNIQDLKNIPLDKLPEKMQEYLAVPLFIDSQVAFVLENYLHNIKVSEDYVVDLQNWKKDFVVYGTIPSSEVEQFYALDHIVLDYFNYIMTKQIQKDLNRDDVIVKYIYIDDKQQVSLFITKQHVKQKGKY